ncbi:MAG: aconitate hydratase, partial [Deltaproteobacteria bacterium]
FLGVRVVLARSFARIHEANLKKQGILPLTFRAREDYGKIGQEDRVSIVGLKDLAPGSPVRALITKTDGGLDDLLLNHTLTIEQIAWFKAGSALNTLRADHAS